MGEPNDYRLKTEFEESTDLPDLVVPNVIRLVENRKS